MSDIQITDQLDHPVATVQVDLSHPSSLVKYLKTEALHLAVFPDYLALENDTLTQAAPTKPIDFQAKASYQFQLGGTTPEISVTPAAQAAIRVNASPGTDLATGTFHVPAVVPASTGYVGIAFQGSLDGGVSGSDGDLTFGLDRGVGVSLEYLKSFPLDGGGPTLGDAVSQTLSSYVIPSDLSDLNALGAHDIATVSGQGSLKISGGVHASITPNPLASVDLPLGAGSIAVQAGVAAGLSVSFTISGSYQVRARRLDPETVELSFLKASGTAFTADLSASGGITAKLDGTELISSVLGAISTDPTADQNLLADLQPAEAKTFAAAIQSGLNHSFQACLDLVLSSLTDQDAAFQYQIQPAQLNPDAQLAVRQALRGDLSLLTAMEDSVQDDGVLSPGVKMLNSVFSETRKHSIGLKINLLGILNYLTVSELIRNSELLTDGVSGDVTIKETVTGNNISALVDPFARQEALRKAIFDSVMMTASYRAGKAVSLPQLSCQQVHFAFNQSTSPIVLGDYLTWCMALNLLSGQDKATILGQFTDGGQSSCVLRTSFTDTDCASMFFDTGGSLRTVPDYLEIGRTAMRALLDPDNQDIDRFRYRIVDDALWPQAREIGANVNLGPLVGLSTADPRVEYLIGDVLVISDWASAMAQAGKLVQDVRTFVGDADPAGLFQNPDFRAKTSALQTKMAALVKASKVRFDEPWGMVSLFWAAGSPRTAQAKITAPGLTLERASQPPAMSASPA